MKLHIPIFNCFLIVFWIYLIKNNLWGTTVILFPFVYFFRILYYTKPIILHYPKYYSTWHHYESWISPYFWQEPNSMKVFTNVDNSSVWYSCYVLTYPSHLFKEADDNISELPSYLHYVYGDEILLMLTTKGQRKTQQSKWDPENSALPPTLI